MTNSTEPWLRGTLTEVPAVVRGVLHALQLADEDLRKWCSDLSQEELNAEAGVSSVAYHIRHIARSLDRLLTYAEGRALTEDQLNSLREENSPRAAKAEIWSEITQALEKSADRLRALANLNLEEPRTVGKRKLPTTFGGLLVHIADHTQRHVGQAIVTAKIVKLSQANPRADKAV